MLPKCIKPKPALLFAAIFSLHARAVSAQSSGVRFLIDTSISIMKENAVNAQAVNWDTLKNNALKQAAHIDNPYELGPVMRYLYSAINDFHGAFFYKDSTFQWRKNNTPVSDSIMNEWKKRAGVKTAVLEKNIGYLRIPSMPVSSEEDFYVKAQNLNDSLCTLLAKKVKGIVLDLRLNGGGAMHPMILGVAQLLGQGHVGSFQTKKKEDWIIKDNRFFVDTTMFSKVTPTCNFNAENIPVVMLISPVTGSSAECLIISFKGRKNTILLGSQTAGYVTINTGIPINDTAFMNLSVGYSADRNGKLYKKAIDPDIPLTATDKFNDIENDEKVKAAINWLKQHFN